MSELALRSKAYWGYPDDFIEACRDELSVDPDRCDNYACAVEDDALLGFYGLSRCEDNSVELDALFVAPKLIGRSVMRMPSRCVSWFNTR